LLLLLLLFRFLAGKHHANSFFEERTRQSAMQGTASNTRPTPKLEHCGLYLQKISQYAADLPQKDNFGIFACLT